MDQLIIEFPNSITEILCDTIIENYELSKQNVVDNHGNKSKEIIQLTKITESNIFEIPKNNENWNRIEKIIYKELLININNYKNQILRLNTVDSIHLQNELNKPLFTNSFLIHKFSANNINYVKKLNRYNVLSYIFYLNTVSDGGEIKFENGTCIIPKQGKLVLFPENIDYTYNQTKPISNDQYIIYGQLCYDNII